MTDIWDYRFPGDREHTLLTVGSLGLAQGLGTSYTLNKLLKVWRIYCSTQHPDFCFPKTGRLLTTFSLGRRRPLSWAKYVTSPGNEKSEEEPPSSFGGVSKLKDVTFFSAGNPVDPSLPGAHVSSQLPRDDASSMQEALLTESASRGRVPIRWTCEGKNTHKGPMDISKL